MRSPGRVIERVNDMPTITTKDGTEIFYKDWGSKDAQPMVFSHGWPLSPDDWDAQMRFFLGQGYRGAIWLLIELGFLKGAEGPIRFGPPITT